MKLLSFRQLLDDLSAIFAQFVVTFQAQSV